MLTASQFAFEAAIRNLDICTAIELDSTLALSIFRIRYSRAMIILYPLLRKQELILIETKTKASNNRFAAWRATNPPMIFRKMKAYAEMLEEKLRVKMVKIAHYNVSVAIEVAATFSLNQFQKRYTRKRINCNLLIRKEETHLIAAKTKAWNDRFAAERDAFPPTLESILWIVAKSGFTKEVASLMNLSQATRECKNLHMYMREVRNVVVLNERGYYVRGGQTQLNYYCENGMTASVVRMLAMRSIDVEAKEGDDGKTCLHVAANNGHLAICRLLIDKGAQVEARNRYGMTPLDWAADRGHVEIVRLLCDHGADVEARNNGGYRPLHYAAWSGHISVVKELIEERNVEINARDNRGRTALREAIQRNKFDVAAYLIFYGGLDLGE